jgi:SAM-dependent methyltransferase
MKQTVYDYGFYEDQVGGSLQSAREVLPVVLSLIKPRSVVDVGCGMGTWLSAFREQGIEDVIGLDGEYVNRNNLLIPSERFIPHDLTTNLALKRTFDLVMSLEVAEHLSEEFAGGFVKQLVSLGKAVLFSAAIPGQGGTHHVNEQWPEYWRALFAEHGYVPVDCLRQKIWSNRKIQVCYRQNIFFYVEKEYLQNSPILLKEQARYEEQPFSLVHPDMLEECLNRPPTFRPLMQWFPHALSEAFRQRWLKLRNNH